MQIKGSKVAVLGLSRPGMNLIKALLKMGAAVTGYGYEGDARNQEIDRDLKKLKVQGVFGPIPANGLLPYDLVIMTPNSGLYLEAFEVAKQTGKTCLTDLEFLTQQVPAKVIAVTGTCGKSTTCGLITQMLSNQKLQVVQAGGELDDFGALLSQKKKIDYLVLEVSSTRLKETSVLKPDIAVLLNIYPAHGERHHGSLMEYADTKAKIFENQTGSDFLVFDGHANNLHELIRVKGAKAKLIKFSIESQVQAPGVYYQNGQIVAVPSADASHTFSLERSRARSFPSKIMDVMAAIAVAQLCGVKPESIQKAIDEFKTMPGRLRQVRKLDGVWFVDDSKSCNIGSAVWALHSFSKPIIWIVGGELGEGARLKHLPGYVLGKVKRALLIGSAPDQLAKYLTDIGNVIEVGSLKKAIELANHSAEAGDVVLFSPACPPDRFDPESGFNRGETFVSLVKSLPRTQRSNLKKSGFVRI